MPSHTLIQDGRARDASQFWNVAHIDALDSDALNSNEPIAALRISNDTDLEGLQRLLGRVESILIDFPAFTDGRGFSLARELRFKYQYEGTLIADGPLIPDQHSYALQCGFDAVRVDDTTLTRHKIEDWQKALDDFDLTYQRGYAIKAGPATSISSARLAGLNAKDGTDPFFGHSAELTLRKALIMFEGEIVFAASMGASSAVLLHMISRIDPNLPIIFLDTGKHFRETLGYRDELIESFGLTGVLNIQPDADELVRQDPNGELHRSNPDGCCNLRKVQPFGSAIKGFKARVTGRRRSQTPARKSIAVLNQKGAQAVINPLADWSAKDVSAYMRQYDLPAHPLLSLGYLSIGCQPCTTRVSPGEDARAGRWRNQEKTECGIHAVDVA